MSNTGIIFSFRFRLAVALCLIVCLGMSLSACNSTGKNKSGPTAAVSDPNRRHLAYGVSITVPPTWKVNVSISQEEADKASLDAHRKAGERVAIFEMSRPPSARNIESIIALFIVNQHGTFLPQDITEQITPEELETMRRDILKREQATAKKNKSPINFLELQLSRVTVAGKTAIAHRPLLADPQGRPVRLLNWDIYLDNGVGLAVKTVVDQEIPGAEEEIINIVNSLRIQ